MNRLYLLQSKADVVYKLVYIEKKQQLYDLQLSRALGHKVHGELSCTAIQYYEILAEFKRRFTSINDGQWFRGNLEEMKKIIFNRTEIQQSPWSAINHTQTSVIYYIPSGVVINGVIYMDTRIEILYYENGIPI